MQQYELGRYLRQRYDGYLGEKYTQKELYVTSSDMDQTIMSLESNLAGVFPPVNKWNPNIEWQPIPLRTIPWKEDKDYRQACIDRKILEPFKIHNSDILMEESQEQEVLRHVQTVASSPASSGIASASTNAGTEVTTMAFSPTGGQLSAFAAMMLSPSSLTHTISPS